MSSLDIPRSNSKIVDEICRGLSIELPYSEDSSREIVDVVELPPVSILLQKVL